MTAKPTVLSLEAPDFAPGLLSIQESPPARLPSAVMSTVGMLFIILLLWAIFGKLDIIASAEGRLVPETYFKVVQPTDAGIGLASAQTVINDASFGVSAQQLHPLAGLQTGTARLG
jgi:hypothetical protein